MEIDELLKIAIESDASDLHLKAGNYPILRIHGKLSPLTSFPRLSPENTRELTEQVTNDFQKERLKEDMDVDLATVLLDSADSEEASFNRGGVTRSS
jgi:twitching motility protein PilT